jgi:hypothetical protein
MIESIFWVVVTLYAISYLTGGHRKGSPVRGAQK